MTTDSQTEPKPKSKPKSKHNDHMALWMLLLVVAATVAIFFWISSRYQQGENTEKTHVDEQGHLHVLGVTLGKTSLKL